MSHEIVKCRCGVIVAQCKCISHNKTVRYVESCAECAPKPTFSDLLNQAAAMVPQPEPLWGVYRHTGEQHVIRVDEYERGLHDLNGSCSCDPRIEVAQGGFLIIHKEWNKA